MIELSEKYAGGNAWVYLCAWVVIAWAIDEEMAHIELIESAILLILNFNISYKAVLWNAVEASTNGLVAKEHYLVVVLARVLVQICEASLTQLVVFASSELLKLAACHRFDVLPLEDIVFEQTEMPDSSLADQESLAV